ncbi:MAG: 16S rRNA (cytosine(1402)-N(4))-methyltransferase RsmH [Ruminococcaceae bacterium]|nr:16S rRNA (cytosine(1402)-N(4))-methyltransferase RsmH [Oscillospiraceae bacterium]
MPFSHVSVLLSECIEALNIRNGFTYVDCTTGGGGHSLEIAKRLGPDSRLICFDRDENAIAAAKERLKDYLDKITFINSNFSELDNVIKDLKIDNLGGVLADLGCSSFQFDCPERGFSYMHNARLDMRMQIDAPLSAYNVVNEYSEFDLKKIIYDYGEERFAPRIAAAICARRAEKPIETTFELSDIIKSAIPKAARQDGPHPAKRTFQAIRIEVNAELDTIRPMIMSAAKNMSVGGRIAVISFHSLEDRLVKLSFKELSQGCTCPRDFPVCVCGKKPEIKEITKKPTLPTEEELENNPRSRSAKLRIAEKI